MTALSAPCAALLDDVLCAVLVAAQATVFGDLVALYIAGLTDPAGFALATAVHAKVSGPDPAALRDRALTRPVRAPFMAGAAPFEMLARIVEALPGVDSGERRTAAQLIRDIHARAAVPVLIVDDGSAAASTFDTSGWQRPFIADA